MALHATDALIVVDLQADFLPGGALAVTDGDAIIEPIEALSQRFDTVLLTQDWHTPGHVSFASAHAGHRPFDVIELPYGQQVLWPDHCIMGSAGARIVSEPLLNRAQLVIRKGFHPRVDSYSGFQEADRRTLTGLSGYLKERGFRRLFLTGLATDFCVGWTALDARSNGFDTYVVEDLTRPIDTNNSLANAHAAMSRASVHRITSSDL
ncbi:MAG TPA: nicotinamidase [Devosiaceae bacterium]|jgi:nicotinamidase/pyrazinamidase